VRLTDKIIQDDTTAVDSASELPTVEQVANVDTNAIPDDEEMVPGIIFIFFWRTLLKRFIVQMALMFCYLRQRLTFANARSNRQQCIKALMIPWVVR
jgi:hypothetical protein